MLGPFATASRLTPIHQVSLVVLSHAASMSTTTMTTTTRDRGDRYGPMEWAQSWIHDLNTLNPKIHKLIDDIVICDSFLICGLWEACVIFCSVFFVVRVVCMFSVVFHELTGHGWYLFGIPGQKKLLL